jgi:hypothetical protein
VGLYDEKPVFNHFRYSTTFNEKICLIPVAGSRIYHLHGFDPDDDPLTFGIRDQVGSEIFRIENVGKNEADVFLKKELDREVILCYILHKIYNTDCTTIKMYHINLSVS